MGQGEGVPPWGGATAGLLERPEVRIGVGQEVKPVVRGIAQRPASGGALEGASRAYAPANDDAAGSPRSERGTAEVPHSHVGGASLLRSAHAGQVAAATSTR